MRESVIVLSPVAIVVAVVVTIALLFNTPTTALFMAYIVGYVLIAVFLYFFYKKSKEEEGEKRLK